jgi:hypothetical protein
MPRAKKKISKTVHTYQNVVQCTYNAMYCTFVLLKISIPVQDVGKNRKPKTFIFDFEVSAYFRVRRYLVFEKKLPISEYCKMRTGQCLQNYEPCMEE